MVRKKITTYIEEDLLRSAKILAARRDGRIYEVLEEALRRYLEQANGTEVPRPREMSLAEALSEQRSLRMPGIPREETVRLHEEDILSETALAERESRNY